MSKGFVEHFFDLFCCFWKKSFQLFFRLKNAQILNKLLDFWAKKFENPTFFRFLQIASKCQEMVPDGFRSVPWTRNTSFPSQNNPTIHQKKFSQNRFWGLEKLFLLIYAWGCLKKQHFRGLQLEFFSLNHESPERVRWVWNSLRSCLKGLWSTFSIYFVVFEKKVFNFFFDSKMPKSLINCLTFELKNLKIQLFSISSNCFEMPGNDPRWLPKRFLDSKHFISIPKHPHYSSEQNFSKPILGPWEAVFAHIRLRMLEKTAFSRPTTRIF